jgi:hypothetical protein
VSSTQSSLVVEYTPEGYVTAKPCVMFVRGAWWVAGPDYSFGPADFRMAMGMAAWEYRKYGPWAAVGGSR